MGLVSVPRWSDDSVARGFTDGRRLLGAAAAILGVGGITWAVVQFDTPLVVAGLCLLLGVAVLAFRVEWATVLVVALLYTNAPVLASDKGVPMAVSSLFIALLGFPLLAALFRGERIRFGPTFGLMLAWLVVLLLSSYGAKYPDVATGRIRDFILEGVLLYWLFVNAVRTLPTLQRAIWTLLAVGALLGGITLYQEATGSYDQQFGGLVQRNAEYLELEGMEDTPETRERIDALLNNRDSGRTGRSKRPGGPVSEPNRYAQILIVLIPLVVFMYRRGSSRVMRSVALGAGALILVGILLTSSRGAFLSLVLLLLVMRGVGWVPTRALVLAGVVLVATVAVVAPKYFTRIESIGTVVSLFSDDPAHQREADGSIRRRTTQMLAAVLMFVDHPILGVGPGHYSRNVMEYADNPAIKFRAVDSRRRAHNLYLEIIAETGLVGLAVFLSIVGLLMRRLWRLRQDLLARDPVGADLATAFCFALLVYLLTGLFLHLSYERYYWFLLAMAGATLHILSEGRTARSLGRPEVDG